jgi:flagellar biosynthesis protein FlhA
MSSVSKMTLEARSQAAFYVVPFVAIGIVALLVVPVPPLVIDIALTLSIGFSLCMFLTAIYIDRPLSLSVFPTLLLVSTLARLSINVASTRLILLHGGDGQHAAGRVIGTFGEFVVGGNYVVGIIVFLILVVVNFVVITKGAGRIAEVGARFILDAMPGKQMAIDADLSSGLIREDEARARRKAVQEEADFYGAMDGASKFVRGDAIAGILITAINIVGGFIIGVTQHGMSAADAGATYTILTVGEGLVSQLPALLISTAAGIVVTRPTSDSDLGPTVAKQLLGNGRALKVAGIVLCGIGLVPGLPAVSFLLLGGTLVFLSRRDRVAALPVEEQKPATTVSERERLAALLPVDLLEIEVGYDLVPLVDVGQGGDLTERITGLRRNLVAELGIILPPIHVRDNLRLRPRQYRFVLVGSVVATGEVRPGRLMALDPSGASESIPGERTTEPAFGLPAVWITPPERPRAENAGYTVVDATTVMVTHLTEIVRVHAADLLGRGEAQDLFDILARSHPRVVEELMPGMMQPGDVIRVLRNLLREGVSIRNLRAILETLAEYAGRTKDTDQLTELTRHRLARQITKKFESDDGRIHAIILDHTLESELRQSAANSASHVLGVDPRLGRKLLEHIERLASEFGRSTSPPVLVTSPDVRRAVSDFLRPRIPGLSVISYGEISAGTEIATLGVAGLPELKK